MRFFGPRGDFLAAESPGLVVYDGSGQIRIHTELEDFLARDDPLDTYLVHHPEALHDARAGAERARAALTWDAAAEQHLALYLELG